MQPWRLALAVCAAPAFVAAALRLGHDPVAAEARRALVHREQGYVGSNECRSCHPDRHASWRRTFHATMTQRPDERSVLGAFEGREVRQGRDSARPLRAGGRFFMELVDPGGRRSAEVVLTVGSRRYQQYFERQARGAGDAFVRLPLLWHVASSRWLPLESVFLGPDGAGLGGHAAEWNSNCILCHNTGPRPGLLNAQSPSRLVDGNRFDSAVGELGIACEACHGPGGEHAASARDPLKRYTGTSAPAFDPRRLDQERALAVCGQCHGARLPQPLARAREWFSSGPTFRVGQRLLEHVTPIRQDTPVLGGADPELYSLRFWGDGTPRLTAYEFQGVTQARCSRAGTLTCQSCHAMHAGDPRGQLRPDRPGHTLCTQCHTDIATRVAEHTRHSAGGSGSQCVACHMPKVVYGILEVHRSHRIDIPDPARDAAAGRPNACTLCHLDRNLSWAAGWLRSWWGDKYVVPARRVDGAPIELADAAAGLLAGDAAARAVLANALGEPGVTFAPDHAAAVRVWLALTMGDGYPAVRHLARRSLLALESRAPWGLEERVRRSDFLADGEVRRADVLGLLEALALAASTRAAPAAPGTLLGADFRLDVPAAIRLTDLQGRHVISIGE